MTLSEPPRAARSVSSSILAEIINHKHEELIELRTRAAVLEQQAYERKTPPRPFAEALKKPQIAVIAEIKKASPSKRILQQNFHPAFMAHAYEQGGAACLSVLTDQQYFEGSLLDLEAARAAANLPVLRKDFIIDRLQIFEAAAHNADAILLIAGVLDLDELTNFRELASSLSIASLVEVHNQREVTKAVDSGAEIIGVNNRDLESFEVSLDTSVRLSLCLPANVIRVSESGIQTRADIDLLRDAGFDAFLVGESLLRSNNPTASLRALLQSTS